MAYSVQFRNGRARIIWYQYSNNKRQESYIKKKEWTSIGIYEGMTPEEITTKIKSLNSDLTLKRWEAVKNKNAQAKQVEETSFLAHATPNEVEQFLSNEIENAVSMTALAEKQLRMHWRSVARMLIKLQKRPWELSPGSTARYYIQMNWSPSHSRKIHALFNRWGVWISARHNQSFISANLTKRAAKHIGNNYQEYLKRSGTKSKTSVPLTNAMLAKARNLIHINQYNWMLVSKAFGLRPDETDLLLKEEGDGWKVTLNEGVECLDIFQPKLKHLEEHKQWKLIPILYEHQKEALTIIRSKQFKRPLVKTIRKHIDPEATAYCGRKAFEGEMIEDRGHAIETVAAWMGHQNIKMLWEKYRNRRKVRLK